MCRKCEMSRINKRKMSPRHDLRNLVFCCITQVKIHRYWPSIEAAMHGTLMIENVAEDVQTDFTIRDFKVTHTTVSIEYLYTLCAISSWRD